MIVCTHSKNCAHTHSHIDTHTNIHKHKSTFIPVINDHKRHKNQWIHSPQTCTHTQRKLFSCDTRQSELIASDSINQREKAKCEREKRERARVRARERKWNQEREARVCWERKRKLFCIYHLIISHHHFRNLVLFRPWYSIPFYYLNRHMSSYRLLFSKWKHNPYPACLWTLTI